MKGQNFRVKLGDKFVAGATSCTLHVAAQTEESSTKDDTAMWSNSEVVGKSWDGSVDALILTKDAAAVWGHDGLDMVGTKVLVSFIETTGTKNRTAATTSQGLERYGYAIVTDVSQTWANKQNGTYSLSFQGVGALASTAPLPDTD